jgi:hypothetical protein
MQNPYKRQILKPGENTQVDVQKDISGGCLFTIRVLEGVVQKTTHFRLPGNLSVIGALEQLLDFYGGYAGNLVLLQPAEDALEGRA